MQQNVIIPTAYIMSAASASQITTKEKYDLLTAENKMIILARIAQLKADQLSCQL